MTPLPDRRLCQERLLAIFGESLPQRGRLTNQLAASAVFVCLYVGAVDQERQIRPSMVLWMSDSAADRTTRADRDAWYAAALVGKQSLQELLASWRAEGRSWYADNTREPLRDETLRAWSELGAVIRDESVSTTSPKPQWSLERGFARLFDTTLAGEELEEAIADWQDDHLGAVGRARIALAQQLSGPGEQVVVRLPGGGTRTLAAGGSSLILQGVIERLAPRLLAQPALLFLSESRRRVDVVDGRLLGRLGIALDAGRLLPDALLFDGEPGLFWFVEAVFSDGPIDEPRRNALATWAAGQGIPSESCRFLTAFVSRTSPAFRRSVSSLAWGSFAWFLDEPDGLLTFDELTRLSGS